MSQTYFTSHEDFIEVENKQVPPEFQATAAAAQQKAYDSSNYVSKGGNNGDQDKVPIQRMSRLLEPIAVQRQAGDYLEAGVVGETRIQIDPDTLRVQVT